MTRPLDKNFSALLNQSNVMNFTGFPNSSSFLTLVAEKVAEGKAYFDTIEVRVDYGSRDFGFPQVDVQLRLLISAEVYQKCLEDSMKNPEVIIRDEKVLKLVERKLTRFITFED